MKHSLFDRIFLSFLLIFLATFTVLIFYSSYATKKALVAEKSEVLTNEAYLIGEQTISNFVRGVYTLEYTQENLQYYSDRLDASIWVVDMKGIMIVASSTKENIEVPTNIFLVDQNFDITKGQTLTGDFYGLFNDEVITVTMPIETAGEPNGMILIHSTVSQIRSVQKDMLQVIYIPFLLLIIISFVLLALISGKIMKPIKKINSVAEEYSTGNFETKMDITSDDEIGQLATTLEYMASELSKLDEYRREFISNISHDFRSPLTSIKGYIEAIQDGTIPPEKQDKYLSIVLNETLRLTKLTSSLLELNNYDSYGLWLITKDFDIIDLVKNAINTFEGKCQEKNISLILNNHCEITTVNADKTKIQQVIYNLLDNAIKFTSEGKSIYITLEEKREKIFVSVKDEGCGIPSDSLNKVWVRFYKADASRGRDKQGTGLGLAITREIIKAHNENINVVSTEGVGSEFTFSLKKITPEIYKPEPRPGETSKLTSYDL
ncbi:MAG: cell wall metabolism sensor histidine kinase WalK [Clostridium sp.]|nr:cell wall metabolism sensor histidine kinase WalK [Clostridium sp.]MCM1399123.1 cell wall metabolism sensor histidine kinase WalK [Clostridium sp.]MCM1459515.1 cell wall metabolism sensor histidine kinase WalK [Bacteroides sp.]